MKNHSPLLIHPTSHASRPHGRRGFSLIELIVVIAIILLTVLIGGPEISKAWKRQKLQSASADIKVLLQRAYSEMQRRGRPVFVQVGPIAPGAGFNHLPIYLVDDANENGRIDFGFTACPTLPGCPDVLIAQYDIVVTGLSGTMGTTGVNQEFSLSVDDVTKVQSNFWTNQVGPCAVAQQPFCDPDLWTHSRALMVDLQGRTIGTTWGGPGIGVPSAYSTGRQLTGPAMLVLTHVDVVNQSFLPPTRFVIGVSPVWSVRVQKQIKDATGTWVTQNG